MNFHAPYPCLSGLLAEQDNDAASRGVMLFARRDLPARDVPAADLSNVIPFARRKRADEREAPLPALDVAARPAPTTTEKTLWRLGALLAFSLAAHLGLMSLFNREVEPLAGIGVEAISAEIVLGDNRLAGNVQTETKSENEVNASGRPLETKPEDKNTETARENPQVKTPDTETTVAEKRADDVVSASEQKPAENKPVTDSKQRNETKPSELAKAPEPETVTEKPAETALAEDPLAPPAKPEVAVAEPKFERPDVVAPEATPKKHEPETQTASIVSAPKKPRETKRASGTGKDSRDRAPAASPQLVASNGLGVGRSNLDTNYAGIVRAHLGRYKRELQSRLNGTVRVMVTFSLNASGAVTSARLGRSSGEAAADEEAVAMVRRASPFPEAPNRTANTFTIPVEFYNR